MVNTYSKETSEPGTHRLFPTTIPTVSTLNYNIRSAYRLPTNGVLKVKSRLQSANFKAIQNLKGGAPLIINIQEANLEFSDIYNIFPELSLYKAYYNNLTRNTAGTVIFVHVDILEAFNVSFNIVQQGYLSYVHCTPKDGYPYEPFRSYNIYLYTGKAGQTWNGAHLPGTNIPDPWASYLQNNTNTTTDTDISRKAFQIQLLINSYAGGDLTYILGGDWNFEEGKRPNGKVETAFRVLLELFQLRETTQEVDTFYTFSSNHKHIGTSRLDRIYTNFTDATLGLVQADCFLPDIPFNVHNTYGKGDKLNNILRSLNLRTEPYLSTHEGDHFNPSDHAPVMMQFTTIERVKSGTFKPPPWVFKHDSFLPNFLSHWDNVTKNECPYRALLQFKTAIKQVAKKLVLATSQNTKLGKLSELSAAIKLYKELITVNPDSAAIKRLLEHFPVLAAYSNLVGKRNQRIAVSKFICSLGTKDDRRCADDMLNSSPVPFDKPNKLKQLAESLPTTKNRLHWVRKEDNDEITNDPDEIATMGAKYWGKIWERKSYRKKHALSWLSHYTKRINMTQDALLLENIAKAIKQSNNSTPGPDSIPFIAYRVLTEVASPILLAAANELGRGKIPPDGFNHGLLFLLPKGGKGYIPDTRPITVPNTDNRIISSALLIVIMPPCLDMIDPSQTALPGRWIKDNIEQFNELFYSAQQKGEEYYLLFLDFKKAFDSVKHQFIIDTLNTMGFPSWVVNTIQGLLTNLVAILTIAGAEQIWVMVQNGTKQGCPLSPLLYAIILDPLLTYLKNPPRKYRLACPQHQLTSKGYVDDIGAGFRDSRVLCFISIIVNDHTEAAGGGVNQVKSKLLCTIEFSPTAVANVQRSAWPYLKLVLEAEYLGILFGRAVTIADIFRPSMTKFKKRILRYQPVTRNKSIPDRIIIVNVFLYTIFSYITLFYLMPDSLRFRVDELVYRFIVPGNTFRLELLRYPTDYAGLRTPLLNFAIKNTVTLAVRYEPSIDIAVGLDSESKIAALLKYKGNRQKQIFTHESLRIKHHIALAHHSANSAHTYDTYISTYDTVREAYGMLYNAPHSEWYAEWDLGAKIEYFKGDKTHHIADRRMVPHSFFPLNISGIQLRHKANNIADSYQLIPAGTPTGIRWNQSKLIFHAHLTAYRMRDFATNQRNGPECELKPHLSPNTSCFICGEHRDDWRHYWFRCNPVQLAYRTLRLQYDRKDSAVPLPDILCIDDILLTHPVKAGHPNDEKFRISFIIYFNFAVWLTRCAGEVRNIEGDLTICTTFTQLAHKSYPALLGTASVPKAVSERKLKQAAFVIALTAELSHQTNILICFTDGSSRDGLGGAGYAISFRGTTYKHYVSLGKASNNMTELYALGMACQAIIQIINSLRLPSSITNKIECYFFPDSKYAINTVTHVNTPGKHKLLCSVITAMVDDLNTIHTIHWNWCPGHSKVPLNETVDEEAGKGTVESENGYGITIADRLDLDTLLYPVSTIHHYYPP
jgi:ribonuclease HI